MHWLQTAIDILQADTDDPAELARIAGYSVEALFVVASKPDEVDVEFALLDGSPINEPDSIYDLSLETIHRLSRREERIVALLRALSEVGVENVGPTLRSFRPVTSFEAQAYRLIDETLEIGSYPHREYTTLGLRQLMGVVPKIRRIALRSGRGHFLYCLAKYFGENAHVRSYVLSAMSRSRSPDVKMYEGATRSVLEQRQK